MHLFKFSFILFFISFSVSAINDNECLKGTYNVEVIHKGQPFGLLPVKLNISKNECIITVSHERLRYLKKNWEIDVCREPVHIKNGLGAVEVIKKTGPCPGKGNSSFCSELTNIFQVIQDDGLIFAPGEKERLSTDHGKVYCSYLLLKKYLNDSLVFNRGQSYEGVLTNAQKATTSSDSPVINPPQGQAESESGQETLNVPRPTVIGDEGSTEAPSPTSDDQVTEEPVEQVREEEQGTGRF